MTTSGTGAIVPNSPIANLGTLYCSGMALTYTDTTHMVVGTGQCRDSTDTVDIIMGATQYANSVAESDSAAVSVAVTINTALQGAGGVDLGGGTAITASRMYAVFAIGDSRGFNAGSALLSLEPLTAGATASAAPVPSLPLGYDCYRYIGSVSMDSSKHIRAFTQTGAGVNRTMRYQVPVAPGSAATSGSAAYATIGVLSTLVPQTPLDVILSVTWTPLTANDIVYFAPAGNVALASNGFQNAFSSVADGKAQVLNVVVPDALNGSTPNIVEVDFATTDGDGTIAFLVQGYVDQL